MQGAQLVRIQRKCANETKVRGAWMENPTVYMLPKMIENNKFNELLSDSIENKGWEVKRVYQKRSNQTEKK